ARLRYQRAHALPEVGALGSEAAGPNWWIVSRTSPSMRLGFLILSDLDPCSSMIHCGQWTLQTSGSSKRETARSKVSGRYVSSASRKHTISPRLASKPAL